MLKLFPSISKKQKVLIFLLLLFIILPQTVSAAWFNPFSWAEGAVENMANGFINALFLLVVAVPLMLITIAASISGALFSLSLTMATTISYTNHDPVNIGWPIVRDLANMIIVLGFVIIGIATSLRIKEYEAKQLLSKLIIAALLVNFSLLICGIFIDGSNIIMKHFFGKVGGMQNWMPAAADLGDIIGNIGKINFIRFAPLIFGFLFFYFVAFFVYFLYGALVLFRVIALWMLVILSPLAFVCNVFPATKNISQMWWKTFSQWCIIIIPAGLFYYIGSSLIEPIPDITSALNQGEDFNYISSSFATTLVPGAFLIVGFFISMQFSAAGASGILNFANRHKGKILGGGLAALSKTGGAIGGATAKMAAKGGITGVVGKVANWTIGTGANFAGRGPSRMQRAKSGLIGAAERVGAVKPGTAGALEGKELKENQARMSALIAQGRLAEVNAIAEGNGSGSNPMERAAAIGALLKSKNFDFENEKHVEGVSRFRDHGGDIGEYTEKEPRLADYDLSAIRNTRAKRNPLTGTNYTETEAKDFVVEKAHVKHLVDTKIEDVNIDILKRAPAGAFKKAGDKFSAKKVEAYKEFATPGTRAHTALGNEYVRLHTELARPGITPAERNKLNEQLHNIAENEGEIRSW